MDLNHIHLNTVNLDSSISFYSKYFDFTVQKQHGDGYFLWNNAGFMMALDPISEAPELPAWFHIGFRLDAKEEVGQLYELMKDDKCKITRELSNSSDFVFFRVEDPSGYTVEIFWEPIVPQLH